MFKIKLPPRVQLICYADDTLVLGSADTVAEVETKVNQALEAVTRWIESTGLSLTVEKTEAIIFTTRRKFNPPTFRRQGAESEAEKTSKCFRKAFRVVTRASHLTSNQGGPREAIRRL